MYTKTQWNSIPSARNCETIGCKYCDNETVVLQGDFVSSYTCPTCYGVPRLNKRKDD